MEAQTEEQRAVEKEKVQAYKDRVTENLRQCFGQEAPNSRYGIDDAIKSLQAQLEQISESNTRRLNQVNKKLRKEMIDAKEPGSHLFTAVDFHEMLAKHPLEVDMKLCNGIEDEFHS